MGILRESYGNTIGNPIGNPMGYCENGMGIPQGCPSLFIGVFSGASGPSHVALPILLLCLTGGATEPSAPARSIFDHCLAAVLALQVLCPLPGALQAAVLGAHLAIEAFGAAWRAPVDLPLTGQSRHSLIEPARARVKRCIGCSRCIGCIKLFHCPPFKPT